MTAVEWLISKIERNENPSLTQKEVIEYIEQAKEMEKQQQGYSEEEVKQIIDATLIEYSDFVLADIPEWFKKFKKK